MHTHLLTFVAFYSQRDITAIHCRRVQQFVPAKNYAYASKCLFSVANTTSSTDGHTVWTYFVALNLAWVQRLCVSATYRVVIRHIWTSYSYIHICGRRGSVDKSGERMFHSFQKQIYAFQVLAGGRWMGERVETTLHHAITAIGQLVYCCALIHAPIMFGYFYSRDQPLYYQAETMVKE